MLLDKTLAEINTDLKERKFSSVELVRECYRNIERLEPKLNSFITIVDEKKALSQAREKDKRRDKRSSIVHGIPFVVKDAYISSNMRTTSASNVLQNFLPPSSYNSTVVRKLADSGAILIGKMNMDAWGHGASSENTDFGPVKNPWDLTRVAGGSSGGPAVSISTRMSAFAIGEDTGGSIRNPAAWCNITGLKVSYGRVSRYGCIAYASSFDTVGPMAKSVEDCAYVLEIIAGKDPYDATSSPRVVPKYTKLLTRLKPENLTLGLPKELYGKGLNTEIKQSIYRASAVFRKLKVKIKEISMPLLEYGVPVYYLIGLSETSSNLARYDGIRYGNDRTNFSEETVRRIIVGTYALSAGYYDAYYRKAQKARTLFTKEYMEALEKCDFILMPVTPTPPTRIGELINNPLENLLADVYTVSQNLVGVPSLSLPCGFTKDGLPIGMQIVGQMFSEDQLLALGYLYQSKTSWHKRKPAL
jgi:aspartyl-tRNA(Asn)/glutamyl-tRNA(Gln) amidotransferase subunit A